MLIYMNLFRFAASRFWWQQVTILLLFHVDTFSYHSTLQQLFKDFGDGNSEQQLANITTKIMQALQTNLEGKSKQYKDPALTQLFLMNNIHYIVRSVRRFVILIIIIHHRIQTYRKPFILSSSILFFLFYCYFRSEAKDLLGDDWVQIHRRVVQQHANQYKRIAWSKVLHFS